MTQQSEMLLVQPLNLDEINLKLKDDDEQDEQDQKQQDVNDPLEDTSVIIDDVELLAILGLPSLSNTAVNSPVDEQGLLDWDNMPDLLFNDHKRKREDVDDIFAQFDFVDAILPPATKKPFVQETKTLSF